MENKRIVQLPSITSPLTSPRGHEQSMRAYSIHKLPNLQPFTMSETAQKYFKHNRFAQLTMSKEVVDKVEEENEKKIIKNMEDSFEMNYADRNAPDIIGEKATQKYYGHYKLIDKIQQQNTFASIKPSIQTQMLNEIVQQNILPCKLGVIKPKGDDYSIKIPNRRYGDRYTRVLSEGLKSLTSVREFKLSNNRIKQGGAQQLFDQIGKNAKSIEIEQNSIGRLGIDSIRMNVTSKESKIETLNLEDNKLGNANVIKLLEGLIQNHSLKKLNLSKNFLTNDVCEKLKQYLSVNDGLEELYIFWNQIKGAGGQQVFEGLLNNQTLVVLDISWNSIGQDSQPCINKICEFLRKNKSLIHLDLSSNFFSKESCDQIAESLKLNKTIYGFHFTGNFGYVDARGFLIVEEFKNDENNLKGIMRIQGLQQIQFNCLSTQLPVLLKDVCWICQGWQEERFSIEAENDPVFLHLQSENYNPVYLPKKNDKIEVTLMVPNLTTRFFYTIVDEQVTDPNSKSLELNHTVSQIVTIADKKVTLMFEKVNLVTKKKHYEVVDQETYTPTITVLPRIPDAIYIPPKQKKIKRVWTFPMSIWYKDFKFDNEELLKQCFEKDWLCSKILKVVKSPEEQVVVKNFLWSNYKLIKETYKYYSSCSPTADVWSISSYMITEFCQSSELIDNKTLKLSDLDLKFIATCSASLEYKGNWRNPERALCRFQFMEFLVRLCEDKYLKSKQLNTFPEAIEALFTSCHKVMSQFDAQKWRDERYFNEQCDDVCKYFKHVSTSVYMRNSSKKVKPGQKNFMCLDELHDICVQANLYDENFVERDANIAFNLSMMTRVDELESDRIFQMSYIEFLEALARIAEKLSPIQIGGDGKDLNYEQRFAQPLHLKLEKLMVILARCCATEDIKNNYGKITTSMFDKSGEENDEYE